jgi:hypothetical protein
MAYTQKQYTESDAVKKFRENMEAHEGMKPADYVSQYQPQIKSTLDSILNRKDFQYDVNGDALYQQYKDRYVNLGQQAMMDTMGQAAKLTGGYGNSNAQMVGQQAYHGYLQGLTDKIPELAQLAYQRYAQQGQDLYQKYGLLNSQEQADYNRWTGDRDWLYNMYNTERGFDYGQYRDAVGDDQWKAQFDEDLRRFDFQNKLGEFAVAPIVGGGGGGDSYSGSSYSGSYSSKGGKGSGFDSAKLLVENSTSAAGQQKVIDNAVSKGLLTSSGAKELSSMVGNTKYTKK